MDGATAHLLRALRVPRRRHLAARAGAAHLLVQLAARRLPALHGARHPARDRPRADRARPVAVDRRGRAGALDGDQLELLRAGDPGHRRPLRDRPGDAVAGPARASSSELFLYGTDGEKLYVTYRNRMGRKRSYMLAFEGIVPGLERRYRETDSSYQKERIEEYMTLKPCPRVPRRPAASDDQPGRHGRRPQHLAAHRAVGASARSTFVDGLELTDTERAIGARILKEIRERLELPRERRRRLPDPRTGRRRRCPAARRSGSGWPRRSAPA